jgi:hypothetical protein
VILDEYHYGAWRENAKERESSSAPRTALTNARFAKL